MTDKIYDFLHELEVFEVTENTVFQFNADHFVVVRLHSFMEIEFKQPGFGCLLEVIPGPDLLPMNSPALLDMAETFIDKMRTLLLKPTIVPFTEHFLKGPLK